MPIEPTHFPSRDAAIDQMVAIISAGLKEAINLRGKASLMLSGGSTPGPVYKALSDVDLDWSKVTVGLVDDRYVHDTDSRSNAKLVRETLLQGRAAAATFLPMVGDGVDPFEHAIPASELYNQALPIDISVMGLGQDKLPGSRTHAALKRPWTRLLLNQLPELMHQTHRWPGIRRFASL